MGRLDDVGVETASLSGLHWLAVALAVATGVLHVYAGVAEGRAPLVLAGVGFFVAVGAFLVDYRRDLLYPLGILYTGVQIPAWAVVNAGQYTLVGYVDKVVQGALVAVLAYCYWQSRKGPAPREGVAGA